MHKGFLYETYNHPSVWKTPCGWNYGCSNFFRVPKIDTLHVQCKKCFNLAQADSSDSEDQDKKDDTSSSDSTSSEEEGLGND